jgi:hypothetical protein
MRGAVVDGRSAEARYLRDYEAALLEPIPNPTVIQRALVVRAARLALHLEMMDTAALESGRGLSAKSVARYVAAANTLSRILARLGAGASEAGSETSLADFITKHDRAATEAAE